MLDDVLDGFITVDHARDDYGVVLAEVDDGYGWALNAEATKALRADLARGSKELEFRCKEAAEFHLPALPRRRIVTDDGR